VGEYLFAYLPQTQRLDCVRARVAAIGLAMGLTVAVGAGVGWASATVAGASLKRLPTLHRVGDATAVVGIEPVDGMDAARLAAQHKSHQHPWRSVCQRQRQRSCRRPRVTERLPLLKVGPSRHHPYYNVEGCGWRRRWLRPIRKSVAVACCRISNSHLPPTIRSAVLVDRTILDQQKGDQTLAICMALTTQMSNQHPSWGTEQFACTRTCCGNGEGRRSQTLQIRPTFLDLAVLRQQCDIVTSRPLRETNNCMQAHQTQTSEEMMQ
jgi:hypothetical protein